MRTSIRWYQIVAITLGGLLLLQSVRGVVGQAQPEDLALFTMWPRLCRIKWPKQIQYRCILVCLTASASSSGADLKRRFQFLLLASRLMTLN